MMDSPKYLLTRVPNDDAGNKFIEDFKKYLNKDRYKVRVRGQGLIDGEDWRRYQYGQPINKSTHIRVYVEEKK